MIKKKFEKWEDEILTKYSMAVCTVKLPHRVASSMRHRRILLAERGVVLENNRDIEANINKLNSWVIPGLDKTVLGKNNTVLILCKALKVDLETLKKNDRHADVIFKKKIFCYFLRENIKMDLEEVASYINKDHATVYYHWKDINNKISIKDKEVIKIINELNKILCV